MCLRSHKSSKDLSSHLIDAMSMLLNCTKDSVLILSIAAQVPGYRIMHDVRETKQYTKNIR